MIELVEFLRARYDEREQAARDVEGIRLPWYFDHIDDAARPFVETVLDPASVLADLDAKRRILDAYVDAIRMHRLMEETDDDGKWDWLFKSEALEGVARLLALPYAGHPDYRTEWAVTE